MSTTLDTDICIIGGGVAGLWLNARLRKAGYHTVLIERGALGGGQSVKSQGIIHGGIKYALGGKLNAATEAIADMPNRWRQCLTGEGELGKTRTVIPNFLEAWFLAPHGLNYHIEHHLYPSVPFYRLGDLHRTLMQDEHFAARAHITRGYLTGLLGEIWLDGWRRQSGQTGRAIPAE